MKIKGYDNVELCVELINKYGETLSYFDSIKTARFYCTMCHMKLTDFKVRWLADANAQGELPELHASGSTRQEAIHNFAAQASYYCKR